MKVVPAKKCLGEDGIYLVKECNAHGKFLDSDLGGKCSRLSFLGKRKYSQQKLL